MIHNKITTSSDSPLPEFPQGRGLAVWLRAAPRPRDAPPPLGCAPAPGMRPRPRDEPPPPGCAPAPHHAGHGADHSGQPTMWLHTRKCFRETQRVCSVCWLMGWPDGSRVRPRTATASTRGGAGHACPASPETPLRWPLPHGTAEGRAGPRRPLESGAGSGPATCVLHSPPRCRLAHRDPTCEAPPAAPGSTGTCPASPAQGARCARWGGSRGPRRRSELAQAGKALGTQPPGHESVHATASHVSRACR